MDGGSSAFRLLFSSLLLLSLTVHAFESIAPQLSILSFFCDLIVSVLTVSMFVNIKRLANAPLLPSMMIMVLVVFDLVMLFYRSTDLTLFLWGARNQYRFLLLFLAVIVFLKESDLPHFVDLMDKVLILNLFVVTVQFFVCGVRGDYLGGTFGVGQGCNGMLNIFICVEFASALSRYMAGEIPGKKAAFVAFICLYWAALAELKYFYLEVAIIALVVILGSGRDIEKKVKIALILVAGLIVSTNTLVMLFPSFVDYFNPGSMVHYFTHIGYGVGGFNRSTALSICQTLFFNNDFGLCLAGLGLGNAEYSDQIAVFNSDFYKTYKLYGYNGYLDSMIFVERGYLGLAWYIVFFALSGFESWRKMKVTSGYANALMVMCLALSFIFLLGLLYDSALRTSSSGYIAFFVMAIPFLVGKLEGDSLEGKLKGQSLWAR
ncbi:hypothetical protein [Adlercreutzia sp. ZJ305]|uniref:hypothetical protein n=1 Tax=Adlercreutzia sp. ZJ305 TaxID=2709408 RepID=UPI0013ECCCD6|nr:hypothetical protein [Adlercreutzia sp. ZJ305]